MLAKFVNGCLYIIHITKGSPKLTQAYSYHFTISVPNYKAKKKKKKKFKTFVCIRLERKEFQCVL